MQQLLCFWRCVVYAKKTNESGLACGIIVGFEHKRMRVDNCPKCFPCLPLALQFERRGSPIFYPLWTALWARCWPFNTEKIRKKGYINPMRGVTGKMIIFPAGQRLLFRICTSNNRYMLIHKGKKLPQLFPCLTFQYANWYRNDELLTGVVFVWHVLRFCHEKLEQTHCKNLISLSFQCNPNWMEFN